ncbi:two-component sensor histidine kinase [Streptomyces sp. ISL-96]|uniref:sensor histidine kinase n=1 Tax=Streptomyces sp. ISL-96 TaxID=2819191 RepID=UPI001BE96575|nr:histidine kinase [Streptomyces sp. ISL-96]MBT2492802.1 two-component sensor histidine kinase [Streptomyces sp. ISL-96]
MRARQALCLLLPACAATVDIAAQMQWAYEDMQASWELLWATVILCVMPVVVLGRRRWPIAVFLATLTAMYFGSYIPSMIALYTVVVMTTRRWVIAVCAVVFLLWSGITLDPGYPSWDNPIDYLILMVTFGQVVLPLALGLLVSVRAQLTARVADLAAARSREDALLAERLVVAERARLAREMHDVVAHQVSLISVEAAALQMTTSDPAVRDSARAVRTMAARTLDELRQVVGVLRGGSNRADPPVPRLSDLPQLIRDCRLETRTRIDPPLLQAASNGPGRWPDPVQHAVYRTVQEALTNVRKHAPGAVVSVWLHESDGHLRLRIHNGPPGPDDVRPAAAWELPSGGYGLIGLAERVHLIGGTFDARVTDEGGHLVTATFPAQHPAQHAPS